MATTATTLEVTPVLEDTILTARDRCDRNKVETAMFRVKMPSGFTLDLCLHHLNKNWLEISAQGGVIIQDVSGQLTTRV